MTTTDHAAIDLDAIKNRPRGISDQHALDKAALIAEVEALRKRMAELQAQNTIVSRRNGEYAKGMADANERAEAAEARVLGLKTVCEFIADMEGQDGMTDALFAEKTLALVHVVLGKEQP